MGTSPNSRTEVLVSAFKNGSKKIIVAINTGTANVKQKISFQGATASYVMPYLTNSSKNAEQGNAIALSDNSFEYTLPPGSVVSFIEQ